MHRIDGLVTSASQKFVDQPHRNAAHSPQRTATQRTHAPHRTAFTATQRNARTAPQRNAPHRTHFT